MVRPLASIPVEAHLELWSEGNTRLITLKPEHVSIGRDEANDIALPFDPTVSRLHAVIVHYRGGWCLRDVGAANGTYLNGKRLLSEQILRPGDEIRVGAARMVFRGDPSLATRGTLDVSGQVPELTRRERDVLLALCRPLMGAEIFAQPASNGEIAGELTIGEAGVSYHLRNLYEKFGISANDGKRRSRLAAEAIRRGVVNRGQL